MLCSPLAIWHARWASTKDLSARKFMPITRSYSGQRVCQRTKLKILQEFIHYRGKPEYLRFSRLPSLPLAHTSIHDKRRTVSEPWRRPGRVFGDLGGDGISQSDGLDRPPRFRRVSQNPQSLNWGMNIPFVTAVVNDRVVIFQGWAILTVTTGPRNYFLAGCAQHIDSWVKPKWCCALVLQVDSSRSASETSLRSKRTAEYY
jgi:hypothetical protein